MMLRYIFSIVVIFCSVLNARVTNNFFKQGWNFTLNGGIGAMYSKYNINIANIGAASAAYNYNLVFSGELEGFSWILDRSTLISIGLNARYAYPFMRNKTQPYADYSHDAITQRSYSFVSTYISRGTVAVVQNLYGGQQIDVNDHALYLLTRDIFVSGGYFFDLSAPVSMNIGQFAMSVLVGYRWGVVDFFTKTFENIFTSEDTVAINVYSDAVSKARADALFVIRGAEYSNFIVGADVAWKLFDSHTANMKIGVNAKYMFNTELSSREGVDQFLTPSIASPLFTIDGNDTSLLNGYAMAGKPVISSHYVRSSALDNPKLYEAYEPKGSGFAAYNPGNYSLTDNMTFEIYVEFSAYY